MPGAGGAGGISAGSGTEGNPRLAAGGPRSIPKEHGSAGKCRAPTGCSPPRSAELRAPRLQHSGSWEGKHGSFSTTRAPRHIREPGAEAWLRPGALLGFLAAGREQSRAEAWCCARPRGLCPSALLPCPSAPSSLRSRPKSRGHLGYRAFLQLFSGAVTATLPPSTSHFSQLNRGTNKPSPTPRRWLGRGRGEDAGCWATSPRGS